jgi:outer membrane protein TolC
VPSAAGAAAPTQPLAVMLNSPELAALVERAHSANPDLGVAAARIQQARAQLRSARAESLPVASASLGIGGTASGRGGSRPVRPAAGRGGASISPGKPICSDG